MSTSNSKKVRRRPKKSGFKGNAEHKEICNKDNNAPFGLLNQGENVCFFNTIIQLLYQMPSLKLKLRSVSEPNVVVSTLKNLFSVIDQSSNGAVRTTQFLHNIGWHGYSVGSQCDSHECMIFILSNIFPSIDDNCIFKIDCLTSTECTSCSHLTQKNETELILHLHLGDVRNPTTISSLLLNSTFRELLPEYKCDNCDSRGACIKSSRVLNFDEYLIIHLAIFDFTTGVSRKVTPNLDIEENISIIFKNL